MLNTFYKLFAGIIKDRIEEGIDEFLHPTQFGFRKQRGTSDAIHVVRRVQEYAEQNSENLVLVLLDWEKAFDKLKHHEMWQALEEIGVLDPLLDILRQLYANPEFRVREEQEVSG